MKLGIIGLPQSGKTTIFNALTRGHAPTTASTVRFEVHNAVVDVPDPRVDKLSAMFKPRKTIYARVTYADIAGLEGSKAVIAGPLLNQLSQMDGFVHVVRCFEDPGVPHPSGSINPARDLSAMDAELLLNDLIAVERKLERLADERRKGGGRERAVIERELALFERLHGVLSVEKPLRGVPVLDPRKAVARGEESQTLSPHPCAEPLASVHADLNGKREPGLNPRIHPPERGIDPVVVQEKALA